jgi:trehalose utilization protein
MRIDRRSFARRTTLVAASALGWLGRPAVSRAALGPVRVRIWCEGTAPKSVYPNGIDGALGEHLGRRKDLSISLGRLDDPDAGLADAALDATDTLIWWGRLRHDDLPDDRAAAIVDRVKAGRLGFVALHASYASKPFKSLMGSSCEPGAWRDDGQPENVSVKAPDHPIAQGVSPFTIPKSAMYAEPFAMPAPETVVLVSSWDRGETSRSGLTWTIGRGRVVCFRPGHEAFPILFHPSVRRVIANATLWAAHRV